jgi:hypothetical protein
MINGVTFRIVRKEDVFKPVVVLSKTATSSNEETEALKDEDNSAEDVDLDPEEAAKRKKERAKEDLSDLDALLAAKGGTLALADKWCIEPPKYPEIGEIDFSADHIALDRPWVLPDTQNLEVFKVVPSPFYNVPGKLVSFSAQCRFLSASPCSDFGRCRMRLYDPIQPKNSSLLMP